jgi:hypothetical protein
MNAQPRFQQARLDLFRLVELLLGAGTALRLDGVDPDVAAEIEEDARALRGRIIHARSEVGAGGALQADLFRRRAA